MSELNNQVEDVYQEAMNAGHAAAWEQDWERAIPAYMTAIRARPEDPSAHNNLGLALLQARRLEDALKVYQRAHRLAPNDPIPLEKSADVLERMGRLQDAAIQYLTVAEIYLGQREIDKAISNWERATRIAGGLIDVHKKLALAYEKVGRKRQAIREYLTLAWNYQTAGNSKTAVEAVERALRLEPQNPQALNALQAIRSGTNILPETGMLVQEREPVKPAEPEEEPFFEFDEDFEAANEGGPLGEAVETALEILANHVMESGAIMEQSGMLTIQAIELHRQGELDDALNMYRQARKAGLDHPAVALNLGALAIELEKWRDAIEYFERVADDDRLIAGAHHGLGIANMRIGNQRTASKHLIQSIKMVDVQSVNTRNEMEQLNGIYNRMLQNANSSDEGTLSILNERFFEMLEGADWRHRIEVTRDQLETAMTEDPTALIDIASVDPSIVEAMNRVDDYVKARRFNLAIEESYYILEREPDYIAAHMRVGQILVHLNRVNQAIEKYNHIAKAYLARGNKTRAGEVLSEIIKVAPMDISVRINLIELLEEDEQWEQVLPEYVYLGDAYMDLADTSNARVAYEGAIVLARRLNAPPAAVAEIMHKLVDIDRMRLDLRGALKTAEQIKQMLPEDHKSREMLIDIHYRLGNPMSATKELDGLLQIFAAKRDGKAILDTLQKAARERPDDEAVRSRLAAIYHQIKRNDAALEQYNILLNLQLNNGRHGDAC
ncbi:MAG: tetratricopeptide repeat protein, partial [Chloroflexi bacterium]|nr:tetratricopeptide repeat protein [Chloroflexota bacterium]